MATLAARVIALRKVPLFSGLSKRTLEQIARASTDVDIPQGQLLIEPNAQGSGLFVIQEGTVAVQTRDRKRVELGAGEVVGELALLRSDGARTARVQAVSPVRCIALDRRSFRSLLESEPKLALALLETLAERLGAPS
jgi:CRP/FNR family transcriptional regulator